ncbi:unnamed protein product [Prorocentrum cordatum]|uniref:Uncharacterized protein n=1 Tax=Prorocentrum cordatum TaxID=2364126 RepID=A0ABN9XGN2_9DINO|nr:unnamed protein product [Polarella glacialis]
MNPPAITKNGAAVKQPMKVNAQIKKPRPMAAAPPAMDPICPPVHLALRRLRRLLPFSVSATSIPLAKEALRNCASKRLSREAGISCDWSTSTISSRLTQRISVPEGISKAKV